MNERFEKAFEDYERMLLQASAYSGNKKPGKKHFSASMLGDDLLQCYLKYKHGIEEQIQFGANSLGSIYQLGVDSACEMNKFKNQYRTAFRLTHTLSNGWVVSGEIDQLDCLNGVVFDNKVTNTTTLSKIKKEGKAHSYALQLGVYKYLLEKNDIKNELNASWISAIPGVDKAFSHFNPKTFAQLEFIPVETYSVDEIEQMLIEKTNELQQYIDLDQEPGECKNLFLYKAKGSTVAQRMRCIHYCDQSKNCKYWENHLKNRKPNLEDLGL